MSILSIGDPHPTTAGLDSTVADAIQLMLDNHVGAVAVVDSAGVVAGIFTERDVLKRLALSGKNPAKILLREMMTVPVELATAETTPAEALAVMIERHYRHLPIVDDNGKLIGMLSIRHVLEEKVDDLTRELSQLQTR
jgi:CBS domain-containing protein